MQVAMEREGIYCKSDCPAGHNAVYSDRYTLVITVAEVVAAACGIVVGFVLDFFGPGVTVFMAGGLMVGGSFVFGSGVSYLIGYAMWAFGGMSVLISAFRLSYVFPSKASFILGGVSCLFDTSTVVFAVVELIAQGGVTLKQISYGYGVFGAVLFTIVGGLWFANSEFNKGSPSADDEEETAALVADAPPANRDLLLAMERNGAGAGVGGSTLRLKGPEDPERPSVLRGFGNPNDDTADDTAGDLSAQIRHATAVPTPDLSPNKAAIAAGKEAAAGARLVCDLPLKAQMRTVEFWFIYIFTIIHMFRNNLYLGSSRAFLQKELHDQLHGNLYSKIIGFIVPLGFVWVGVVGFVLDKWGFAVSAHAVNALGLLYGAFTCIPALWAQPVAAFFFAAYRALLFSFVAAFTAVVFGPGSVGRITGVLYTSTAVFVLLITPLVNDLSVKALHDNFFPLHLGATILVLVAAVLTWWASRRSNEMGVPAPEPSDDIFAGDAGTSLPYGAIARRGSFASIASTHSVRSVRSQAGLSFSSRRGMSFSSQVDNEFPYTSVN